MAKDIWINLPVKDLDKSRAFFSTLGFRLNPRHANSNEMVSLVVGDNNMIVMLFPKATFEKYTSIKIADTQQAAEVLFSIGADSKEEVDEMVSRVEQAGGTLYSKPHDQGWLYGAGFADLDGHRWNIVYMDFSKMPGE